MTSKEKKAKELKLFIHHIFSDGRPHSIEEVSKRAKISYNKAAGMLYGFSLSSEKWAKVWREDNIVSYRCF